MQRQKRKSVPLLFENGRWVARVNENTLESTVERRSTMTITLELPPHVEAKLRETAARRDHDNLRRLLTDAVAPIVEALLREPAVAEPSSDAKLNADEFESLLDQFAEEFESLAGPNVGPLPDEAVTRAGIYRDHP